MIWNDEPREPDNRLQGTSQGKRTDFPPKEWIRSELEQVGALDTGKNWNPNLTGKLHPLFDRRHWPSISTRRFDALEQSFQISTRLLKVAGPYLCNFLPDPKFNGKWIKRLEVNDSRSFQEINAANTALLDIVDHLQWRESPDITPKDGFLGLNHYGPEVKHNNLHGDDTHEFNQAARRAKRDGLRHRQLTISITSQFVDSLLAAKKGSHAYMVAAFAAAITIVHELGHTIFLHDIRYSPKAFWVGNDLANELGHSFIAWLFDGWIPELIRCDDDQESDELRAGFYWRKQLRQPMSQPKEKISYSVPMTHIQRMLDHKEWSNFDFRRAPCASSRRCRSALLSPKTPFKNGEHARIGAVFHKDRFNLDMNIRGFTGDQQARVDNGTPYFPVDQDWDDGSELPRRSDPAAQPLGRLLETVSPKPQFIYWSNDNEESSDTGNDNEESSDTGNDNEESSDTGDDSRGPFMNRPGFEYFSENDSYGDFGVRLGFTEPVTSDKSEPRHEFTEQPINPANPKKPVIKVSETDSCPEIVPKPDRAYPGDPSPKETQQPPLLTWEEQPLRKSSLDTPLIPHPHPSPRQETGARRAPIRFPTPASYAGSERSTARITRPKRKVAELDNDALGDTERKGRGRGTRDDPIAVDR